MHAARWPRELGGKGGGEGVCMHANTLQEEEVIVPHCMLGRAEVQSC